MHCSSTYRENHECCGETRQESEFVLSFFMAYQADSVVLAWSFEIIKAGTSENGIPVSDKRARREVRDAYYQGRYEAYST